MRTADTGTRRRRCWRGPIASGWPVSSRGARSLRGLREPSIVSPTTSRWSSSSRRHEAVLSSPMSVDVSIRQLTRDDVGLMEGLLETFGSAFNEEAIYGGNRPSASYLRGLLGTDYFIAIAALKGGRVVGGLAAYELKKFEQQRSEVYIYDLAVEEASRREGIATSLIHTLAKISKDRGAHVIFVQADQGDDAAIAL